ncbi:MAG: hypothetical protein PHO75_02485 [Candidatus Shapirobacteria bacterium]|nr:hypothetical protein [Candidatus Shapirobacteria bacterium]
MANKYTAEQLKLTAPSGGFQTGGWYQGRQYWNGTFSDPGVEHPESNSATAGKTVSSEVNAASAKAQGVSVDDFNSYLNNLSVKNLQPATSVSYTTNPNNDYVSGLNEEVLKAKTALDQNLATQRAETQAKLEIAKKTEADALKNVEQLTTPFRADLETSKGAELGVPDVLASQKSLLDELDTLLTEGNALIKQQQEVTGLSAIRNPRIQKTMSDISARAGVINAVVALQNTYLANAYTSIDRSVTAITNDRKDQLNYYSTVLDLANRDIISLTSEDRKLADSQTKILENELNQAQTTSNYIKGLMVNPDTAMALAQSGVTLNDSVETINSKLAEYQYSKEVKDEANKLTTAGGVWVSSPSGIPADQLKSFVDSKGKVYYYKMPSSKTGTGGGNASVVTIESFNNDAKTVDWSQEQDSEGNTVNISPFMKLVINYAKKMTLDEIYKAYKSSSLGQAYGDPTENYDMIKALYNQAKGL